MRVPVGVLPLGVTFSIASATFPLSCFPTQDGGMENLNLKKTHLNTGDTLELEQVAGVQEAKINAVGVPSFIDDIISETVQRIFGLGPALALHL